MLEHKHLIVSGTHKKSLTNETVMREWVKNLISNIDMEVAKLSNGQSNPIAWYSTDPLNQGMTAVGILTTSHTALHTWDDIGDGASFKFDLYSCKDFDIDTVLFELHKLLDLDYVHVICLDRNNHSVGAIYEGPYSG